MSRPMNGMRPQDITCFREAARDLELWILVRATNPLSLGYIGLAGFTPKPVECKPKTADVESHPAGGLVADPFTVPEAFSASKLEKAKQLWRKNAVFLKLPLPTGTRALPDRKARTIAKS